MIRFWRFLLVWHFLMAALLAYKGDSYYLVSFIMAAYCGYQLECQKKKEKKDE